MKIGETLAWVPLTLLGDLDLALPRRSEKGGEGRVSPAAGWEPEPGGGNALENRAQPSAVVEIRVARDDEVETRHPERGKSRNHGGSPEIHATGKRRRAVDEDRSPSALDDDGVALPHIECHHAWRWWDDCRRRAVGEQSGSGRREYDPARGRPEPCHQRGQSEWEVMPISRIIMPREAQLTVPDFRRMAPSGYPGRLCRAKA